MESRATTGRSSSRTSSRPSSHSRRSWSRSATGRPRRDGSRRGCGAPTSRCTSRSATGNGAREALPAALVAALAEREPWRRARSAGPTAADRRRAYLGGELLGDPLRRRLLERGGPLQRHAPDVAVLEREPAEDAGRARRLLRLLERRVPEAVEVEQPLQDRPGRSISCERQRERPEQLDVVLVDGRVDELPDLLEREPAGAFSEPPLDDVEPDKQRSNRLDREPAVACP